MSPGEETCGIDSRITTANIVDGALAVSSVLSTIGVSIVGVSIVGCIFGCVIGCVVAPERSWRAAPDVSRSAELTQSASGEPNASNGITDAGLASAVQSGVQTGGFEVVTDKDATVDDAELNVLGTDKDAEPKAKFQGAMPPVDRKDAPAKATASLSPRACMDRLRALKIPVKPAGGASGVATPLRLDGALRGVSFRGPGPTSKHSILDCRLVLALDAFAEILESHGVTAVYFGNTYRPRAKFAGKRGARPSQHSYGLAMDIDRFDFRDGTLLRVDADYRGTIGAPSCGPDAVISEVLVADGGSAVAVDGEAKERISKAVRLRELVCDVGRAGIFHHILTPNYDAAHRTHLHLDIQRDSVWTTVR